MYKSSYTEVDSSAMKNPVMYDIDKDGKADILGSMGTGWPGYPYVHNLIIFGQDYVTNIKGEIESVPKNDYLFQNYPNPFNSITKIKWLTSRKGYVNIIVYDVLGKEIQTLENKNVMPGIYETKFNGSALASGIYFYALKINGITMDVKKLVLIK